MCSRGRQCGIIFVTKKAFYLWRKNVNRITIERWCFLLVVELAWFSFVSVTCRVRYIRNSFFRIFSTFSFFEQQHGMGWDLIQRDKSMRVVEWFSEKLCSFFIFFQLRTFRLVDQGTCVLLLSCQQGSTFCVCFKHITNRFPFQIVNSGCRYTVVVVVLHVYMTLTRMNFCR